ncbi:hypothetical protein FRX31_026530 [Thalictrum thalictroides]|uniref:Uncharacterized protein n=1 Tax=Thalictrum thalictroides TaxID=46969 RepID=A0A7J6VG52_THATH|nr:hypothetical protein FRX31_026530 [Thalictrum thalictroides]
MAKVCGSKQKAMRLMFNGFIYWTWGERYKRIFDYSQMVVVQLDKMVVQDVRIKLSSLNLVMKERPDMSNFMSIWNVYVVQQQHASTQCTWEKAKEGIYSLNTDGTLQGNRAARQHTSLGGENNNEEGSGRSATTRAFNIKHIYREANRLADILV